MRKKTRVLLLALSATATIGVLGVMVLAWMWRDRASPDDLPWTIASTEAAAPGSEKSVTATWLGISTIVFDDGETQIIVDGAITRPTVLDLALARPVRSDVATINYVMDEYRLNRLAAIVAGHAHIDHAIDIGHIANRSRAVVLGSESIVNIARGADVPVDQYQTIASGETRVFGDFSITLIASRHAPMGPDGDGWFAGTIDEPLEQPARAWAWRSGEVSAILLEHPQGSTIIKNSAGLVEGELDGHTADVALLSVAGLSAAGEAHAERYWHEAVRVPQAGRVFAIHYDDFTQPFGTIALFPRVVDDVTLAAEWINRLAEEADISVQRLPFGRPVTLY